MSNTFIKLTSELYDYAVRCGTREDEILRRLREETAKLGGVSVMQIAPDEGALLTLLVRAIGARRAIEVGTFTGYSAISIARGLPEGGQLLCCDVNEQWTGIARRYFAEADVARKIDLRIAPAIETLRALPAEDEVDFAFIDADKTSYAAYYEELLGRLRVGGLILIDNVLWNGRVIDPADQSEDTRAIRELNETIARDARVDVVLLAIADGITMVRKRHSRSAA